MNGEKHICHQNFVIENLKKQIDNLIEFKGEMKVNVEFIKEAIEDIKNNHLKHINNKINALLFTVLGSVFIMIISLFIKLIIK